MVDPVLHLWLKFQRNIKQTDSVADYARQWAKREKEDLDILSEWVTNARSLIQIRIKKLSGFMSSRSTSSILKLCFQFMDLDSRYLGLLANTSRIYGHQL
jgi:hypothetical protein